MSSFLFNYFTFFFQEKFEDLRAKGCNLIGNVLQLWNSSEIYHADNLWEFLFSFYFFGLRSSMCDFLCK